MDGGLFLELTVVHISEVRLNLVKVSKDLLGLVL